MFIRNAYSLLNFYVYYYILYVGNSLLLLIMGFYKPIEGKEKSQPSII